MQHSGLVNGAVNIGRYPVQGPFWSLHVLYVSALKKNGVCINNSKMIDGWLFHLHNIA